jgi:hypothetical protein
MKILVTDERIVVLENVKDVNLAHSGSGAKSNPYYYYLHINYFGGESVDIEYGTNEKGAKETFNKITEILLDK